MVVGTLLATQVGVGSARAATPEAVGPAQSETRIRRLSVLLVARIDSPELRALIGEWLEPTGLELSIGAQKALEVDDVLASDVDPERVRVWLTLVGPRLARLYLADPGAARFLVRDVPLEQGLGELGREQLAQVLLSAAQAFVERRESSPRAAVTETLPAPRTKKADDKATALVRRTAATPKRYLYWSVGARYGVALEAPGVFAHGPGATFESAVELPGLQLGVLAEALYELPHRAETDALRIAMSSLALRLRIMLALIRARERKLSLEIGAGLDRPTVEPEARAGSEVQPRARFTYVEPSVGGAVAHYWYGGPLRFGIGIRADFLLHRTHYDILIDGRPRREIRPFQAQPGVFIGAAWN